VGASAYDDRRFDEDWSVLHGSGVKGERTFVEERDGQPLISVYSSVQPCSSIA
jgi:hypothetical protein